MHGTTGGYAHWVGTGLRESGRGVHLPNAAGETREPVHENYVITHTDRSRRGVSGFFGGRTVHVVETRHTGEENQDVADIRDYARPQRKKKKKDIRSLGGMRFKRP